MSSYIHARETRLLNREAMERMIVAPTDEEVYRVLEELGYEGLAGLDSRKLEEKLTESRLAFYRDAESFAPDPSVLDVFKLKYDYHNAKAILKGIAIGKPETDCLSGLGRVPAETLMNAVIRNERGALPNALAGAIAEAEERLAHTGNPQSSDLLLDRACYAEMHQAAEKSNCKFLQDYVTLLTDITNLRSAVRVQRQDQPPEFLENVLLPGGSVKEKAIREGISTGASYRDIFSSVSLRECAEKADEVCNGGSLTEFERLCDNTMNAFCAEARRMNYGPAVLIAYLHFLENETTAVRIIITGRAAGLSAERIRERLREV